MTDDLPAREIAELQELLGDLLAAGHSVEESAAFLTQLTRGDVNDAQTWDGESLLW